MIMKSSLENAPFLFNNKDKCEIKLKDLTTEESPSQNKPVLKESQGILDILKNGQKVN